MTDEIITTDEQALEELQGEAEEEEGQPTFEETRHRCALLARSLATQRQYAMAFGKDWPLDVYEMAHLMDEGKKALPLFPEDPKEYDYEEVDPSDEEEGRLPFYCTRERLETALVRIAAAMHLVSEAQWQPGLPEFDAKESTASQRLGSIFGEIEDGLEVVVAEFGTVLLQTGDRLVLGDREVRPRDRTRWKEAGVFTLPERSEAAAEESATLAGRIEEVSRSENWPQLERALSAVLDAAVDNPRHPTAPNGKGFPELVE